MPHMKGTFGRIALTVASIAIVVGLSTLPARPQFTSNGATVTTQIVTSTSPTGQSSVLALNGLYSNCSVIAAESSGGAANITVYGNGQTGQTGPGGSPIVNSNFGTAGVIAVTPTLTVTSGNVANLPVGLYFTWAANTGTLTAYATCTAAIARAGGGSAAGSFVSLQATAPPSPQAGYAALTGVPIVAAGATMTPALWIGPNPAPAAVYQPQAVVVTEGGNGCASSFLASWGTTSATANGVHGDMFSVGCANSSAGPWFNIDGGGSVGAYNDIYCCATGSQHGFLLTSGGGIVQFPFSSTTVNPCLLKDQSGWGAIQLYAPSGGTCTLSVNALTALSALCGDAASGHNTEIVSCADTHNVGTTNCTATSSTTCNATATVRSGSKCFATMAGGTLAGPYYSPVAVNAVGNLTITLTAFTSGSGTMIANYWCP